MNFGQNSYNCFLSNTQSLVLMAIAVIGVYFDFKREVPKLIGFLVIALIAVGLVFKKTYCYSSSTRLSVHKQLLKRHKSLDIIIQRIGGVFYDEIKFV